MEKMVLYDFKNFVKMMVFDIIQTIFTSIVTPIISYLLNRLLFFFFK